MGLFLRMLQRSVQVLDEVNEINVGGNVLAPGTHIRGLASFQSLKAREPLPQCLLDASRQRTLQLLHAAFRDRRIGRRDGTRSRLGSL
jgi:hypothetical protein